jgi:glycosyl transferase, family 25
MPVVPAAPLRSGTGLADRDLGRAAILCNQTVMAPLDTDIMAVREFFAYFDAYVVNLPARRDRRVEFGVQLESIGQSWDAVRLFPAIRPTEAGPFASVGTRGCFLSQLEVLRKVRDKPILILEDDLNFARDFAERAGRILQFLSENPWGVFYGGHDTHGEPVEHLQPFPADKGILLAHMVAFHKDIVPRVVDYLEAMLRRPAGDPEGGPMHVDGAYSWFRKANPDVITRLAVPQLGCQRHSRTDIHRLKWHDRTIGVAQATAALRRMRNRLGR